MGKNTVSFAKLLTIGKGLLKANGLRWTILYLLYWAVRFFFKLDLHGLYGALIRLEEKRNLPGFNAGPVAQDVWDLLPWEKEKGEEWTESAQWKQSLVDDVMLKYVRPGSTVLEIGPGAGRWTEILQPVAKELIAVDVSAKAIALCRKRLSTAANVKFFLAGDARLDFIADGSVDAIWSFDVFVHINPDDTEKYLASFKRVLASDGIAVIHHPKAGCVRGGCRSRMTADLFLSLVNKHGFILIRQFDSWGDREQYNLSRHNDCVTVFRK